jgi:diguanylate cyclase (GGDEF)-like protein
MARILVRVLVGALFAVLAGYVVSLLARPVGDLHPWLDGWGVSGFELVVGALIVARGLVRGQTHRYTTLLGLAGVMWALGDFANTYVGVTGEHPGSPALFNFLWASYFPLAFAALMVLMNREVIKVAAANYLDGLLLLLAAAAVLIAFLFAPIHHATGQDTATVATNLIYPVLDMPVLGLLVIGLVLSPLDRRARWYLLVAAGVANMTGDWVAVFPQMTSGLLGNVLNAAAWPTSLLLIATAFWLTPGSDRPVRENHASGFWVPTAAALVAVAILFVGIVSHVNRVGMGVALLALVVSGVRFVVALRHSRALAAQREQELHAVALREHEARNELEAVADELRTQSQRDAFGTKLSEALEMADEESQAYEVVTRAMVEIAPSAPAELLLADSSRAHLRQVAHSPAAEAPGCPVDSPFSCVAVRRGQPVTFESSEALNACPKLRGRASGPCSAVCVPVGFMGRALGVLHATGPVGSPPTTDQTVRIATLATQTGARIGTLRAFEKSQLQASTDALTGLINRRALEAEIRELLQAGVPFALAVADLDKFKAINDTYGHDAGDRALRLFSQVATAMLRDDDLIARWGGEEFTIVLPGIDRHQAVAILDRIRDALGRSHSGGHPGFSVSFGVTDTSCANSIEQLLQVADHGLYSSKQNGRDRVTIADNLSADETEWMPPGDQANGQAIVSAIRMKKPALHNAADEPDPRPTGREIR